MAEVTKAVTVPGLATHGLPAANRISGLLAGEALAANDFVYIANTGRLMKATGAAANAAALSVGCVAQAADSGEPATAVFGCVVEYGSGLTPGARLYISGTVAGGLADAASTGGTVPVAIVKDATRIYVLHPNR